jgi:hypothetical protein
MHNEVYRRRRSPLAQVGGAMLMAAMWALLGSSPLVYAESSDDLTTASSDPDQALIILSTLDMASFHEAIALVQNRGGEVPLAFPPNAFIATLNPRVERALSQHPTVSRVERDILDPATLADVGGQAEEAAHVWNTVFQEVPDPNTAMAPDAPVPQWDGPDFFIPPPEDLDSQLEPDVPSVLGAPTSTQTSEFMAGTIVYSVVFVESSGGTGRCSPADAQTENWSASRQSTVLSKIGAGLTFWTSRTGRPNPLTFMLDNRGTRATSCEPIRRPSTQENLWIADALTAMGFPATPTNYMSVARSFAHSRRTALGANWGYIIFVVDSLNDSDGTFSNGQSAYAYGNGPFMVLTYDNGGWGIDRMDRVALHETGHIFGALDEYASGCSTADRWGYLTVANASCNNGGITSDISVMGEASELANPSANVSTSARGAIGWRNPSGNIVDVVRTATVVLTPYSPDPTTDRTPTYSAVAGNQPFPPGGCNTIDGICYRMPSPVTVSKVKRAQWKLDGGSFTSTGLTPTDGAFDEETGEGYRFTPTSSVSAGTHTFYTRSTNHFGHNSNNARDTLTLR